MTCTNCKFHFCWICMGDWNNHGPQTGGFYNCNLFRAKLEDNETFFQEEKKRKEAAYDIKRYEFYFIKF